jgi:hypothetical protein
MISLYNEVRMSSGNTDTLPSMPMFEYEVSPAVNALGLIEQSVRSYLNELTERYHRSSLSTSSHGDAHETESIRDSALDTFSDTSSLSLLETVHLADDLSTAIPSLMLRPEQRSSSSSDEKKTIVSSSSPPSSHHSHVNVDHSPAALAGACSHVDDVAALHPLTIQLAQIDRQMSDEGYRSVRNEQQQFTGVEQPMVLLTRSTSYDCTDKVDQWLSKSTGSALSLSNVHDQQSVVRRHQCDEFQVGRATSSLSPTMFCTAFLGDEHRPRWKHNELNRSCRNARRRNEHVSMWPADEQRCDSAVLPAFISFSLLLAVR